MIHVLLSQPGSYRDVTQHLVERGARVTVVGPAQDPNRLRGKKAILKAMFSPTLRNAWGVWTRQDRLLVVGWQALPILALIKLRLLPRPERLLVMACFIHGNRARAIVNRAWRMLRFPGLGFITFSPGEARNLVDEVGIAPEAVHFHLWRQDLDGKAEQQSDKGYIFAGGFSNRDYDLLIEACRHIAVPLVIVASDNNQIMADLPAHVTVHRNLPEQEFEALLAGATLVAMPLKSQGEACGQSVLLRVLRNGKPMVTTRHEAIEAYLGKDYPGFVERDDVAAMRANLERALGDGAYRTQLEQAIRRADEAMSRHDAPGAEIARFLAA
jgi:glycosyltransferase involved in cell wall biosynthesis